MATITLRYDGRNRVIKDLLSVILKHGAEEVEHKNGLDEALDDIKKGNVHCFTDEKKLFKFLEQ